ncbi:peptidase [Clostridium pasteurianum DSM 525 = ATCC 6013]|uniref:Peptidase n=1 Tax=Clostridium pasteurianum DSM 525 = ATCC 6013 TaxID=1262449 RepID=A0A0H3J9U7_CLOPA|nr:C39 family peptidase [Clostridium pasteurianum]AJA47990.1 peptidase [Clostridium pasteurianum DSM 525 = ATCC 6013]AJA51978.1 peptidase [Clostridium pasteurianum DSM 525 = ATCC 6013]AOZ75275.1 hypothetical protein AQ983_09325 [Clostridium pasteurianum DSM 525 = ATCC 6013]AOZ79070.1 hypothetical protein AQ984_09315 [Clostridium pasteurianum]ELP59893.1 hypothetical protein F502_08508 [Clostridium pasteurianum DSM 525 = ATCC 6013]
MKTPLGYQSTEYDCVPTTFINALKYLFERHEIFPEIIKNIYMYSLDTYNKNGKLGGNGTSYFAVELISNCINEFSKSHNLKIKCETLKNKEINLKTNSKVYKCLNNNGVAAVKVYFDSNIYHYVLLTSIDDDYVYVFDPYYRKRNFKDKEIKIIMDKSELYNRKISKSRFTEEQEKFYAMSLMEDRECTLIYKL